MRTMDILPLANDAPLADIDFAKVSTEIARALNIALVGAILAIVATGLLGDASLNRWVLIGGAPALSTALLWPMCERRGLDRMMVSSERAGMWPFLVANVIAFGMMKTIGDVVAGGYSPLYLAQLLLVPAMLTWMRRDAVAKGWLLDEGKAEG